MEPEDYIKDLDDDTKDIENNGDGDVVLLQVDRLSISKLDPEINKDFEGKCSHYEKKLVPLRDLQTISEVTHLVSQLN